jgi:hypothetical protein
MKRFNAFVLAAVTVLTVCGCKVELSTPDKELRGSVMANIEGMNAKDSYDVLDSVHSQSPYYEQMQMMVEEINKLYTLKSELLSFEYMGQSGEYATALVKQKTEKIDGPEFRNNIVTTMTVFRKDGEAWKIWQSLTLDVEYL